MTLGLTVALSEIFLQTAMPTSPILNEGIIGYLIQNAPALAILIYFAYRKLNNEDNNLSWLKDQLKMEQHNNQDKMDMITSLNETMRKSEKENLEIMSQMNEVLTALTTNVKLSNTNLSKELESKLEDLKKYLDETLK